MERCFIITKNADLYSKYYTYKEHNEKNQCKIEAFIRENIDSTLTEYSYSYVDAKGAFSLAMSDVLHQKLKAQLLCDPVAYIEGVPLYQFKGNSTIGRRFKTLQLEIEQQPTVDYAFTEYYADADTRLFEYNGTLYASIASQYMSEYIVPPYGWQELKRLDFYAILVAVNALAVS